MRGVHGVHVVESWSSREVTECSCVLQRCVGGGPVERESTNIIYLLLCVSLVLLVHMYSTSCTAVQQY